MALLDLQRLPGILLVLFLMAGVESDSALALCPPLSQVLLVIGLNLGLASISDSLLPLAAGVGGSGEILRLGVVATMPPLTWVFSSLLLSQYY